MIKPRTGSIDIVSIVEALSLFLSSRMRNLAYLSFIKL